MLQRANVKSWGPLFWGCAPGADFNPRPRVKEEAGQQELCSDTLASGVRLEEVASTESWWWARWDPPHLHPSTCLCTQPGLSHRERRPSGQRDGVQFSRRWVNLNIWFCHGSHGLFTEEIKAYLFLAQDRYRFLRLYVSGAQMSSLTIALTVATPKRQHPSSSLLGKVF